MGRDGEAETVVELNRLILDHLQAVNLNKDLFQKLHDALHQLTGPVDSELARLVRPRTPASPAAARTPARVTSGTVVVASREPGPWRGALPVLIVLLLSLMFLPCVTYSEWYIDELFAAVRNADARGESTLRQVFSHDFWGNSLWDGGWTHKSYRPLVVLSYAWQYALNNGLIRPQPLRAFNVALHTANSILLYFLLRRYRTPWRWACLGAGLFACHPVHAENVIYLVGRADAMATHCWLIALLVWPQPNTWKRAFSTGRIMRVLFATALAVIGGLCKEIGFVVLLQLAVGELLSARPARGSAPLLAIFGAVFVARNWLTDGTKAGFSYVDTPVQYHDDAQVRAFTYLYFHAKYAQLMIFPWTLSWDYSLDALPLLTATWRDLRVLAILSTYLGVVALASWGFSIRSRKVLLGISNVIIPFVPASNLFFVVGVTVGERLLYPCNVGFAVLIASLGSSRRIGTKATRRGFGAKAVLGLLLLAVFLYRGSVRVYQWSSRDVLFGPDAAAYPRSTKARHQYGTVLHREGRFDEALDHFKAALAVFPQSALTEYCIAQIYIETGRAEEARQRFESIFAGHALGFGRFNLYTLYIDYGFSLMLLKRFEDAIPLLLQGLGLNEDVPHGLNGLGYSYMQLQRIPEAVDAFQRGVSYDSMNPLLLNNLGVAYLWAGNVDAGAQYIAQAVQLEPGTQSLLYNAQLLRRMVDSGRWPTEQFALELFYNRGN